jgi:hypothetical protein
MHTVVRGHEQDCRSCDSFIPCVTVPFLAYPKKIDKNMFSK